MGEPLKALVVVPNQETCRAAVSVLSRLAYEVQCDETLESALPAVGRLRPQVIVVDGALARQTPAAAWQALTALAAALEATIVPLPASFGQLRESHLIELLVGSFLADTLPPLAWQYLVNPSGLATSPPTPAD